MNVAQINIGRLHAPIDAPQIADFAGALDEINRLADRSPGFVWRLTTPDADDATGLRPYPDDLVIVNMSVWVSLEALRDYVYRSAHLDFLRRRREWFGKLAEEHHAMWWLPAGARPTLAEGLARLNLVRERGSTPVAFTFRQPYPRPDTLAACQ